MVSSPRSWAGTRTLAMFLVLAVPLVAGWHWGRIGWRDRHRGYPSVPTSLEQIVSRFGQPCSSDARAIVVTWLAADTGEEYAFRVHRRLAGMGSPTIEDQGGRSTNLDTDVHGHVLNQHLASSLEHGIYGYACRAMRSDPTRWSTHAWGIAVDVSTVREPMGSCESVVNAPMAPIWTSHGWHWGLAFCDPMHFQYARNY